jgi:hypothetical protein
MSSSFTPELKKILLEAGCYFERQGKGDHEIWYSPITNQGASHFLICHCERNEVERGNPINSLILKIVGLLVCDTLRERRSSSLRDAPRTQ